MVVTLRLPPPLEGLRTGMSQGVWWPLDKKYLRPTSSKNSFPEVSEPPGHCPPLSYGRDAPGYITFE